MMLLDTLPAKGAKEHAHTVKQSLSLKKKIKKKLLNGQDTQTHIFLFWIHLTVSHCYVSTQQVFQQHKLAFGHHRRIHCDLP